MRSSLTRSMAAAGVLALACSVYEAPEPGLNSQEHMISDAGSGDMGAAHGGVISGGTPATSAGTDTTDSGGSLISNGGTPPVAQPNTVAGAGADTQESAAGAPEGGSASPSDDCPADPDKLVPGDCGCGIPDKSTSSMSDCHVLKAKLTHRYDFEGTGTTVKDRVGTAHGVVKATALSTMDGKGVVLLGGGFTGGYVDLPNKLLSTLTSVTLEAWITWGGDGDWQRVFDFGDSTAASPEDNPAAGKTYLYLTPRSDAKAAAAIFSTDGWTKELRVIGPMPLPSTRSHVAVVADATKDKLRLFIEGKLCGEQTWTGTLASINDVNVWLGRSQYDTDPELSAVFHEFRVYGSALTEADIAASYAGGPDPAFLAY